MRQPLPFSLGAVFLVMAALPVAGLQGAKLPPEAYVLVGLLGLAGGLILVRLAVGYYVALLAAGLLAISGVLAWAGVRDGRFGLPIHPGVPTVVGLYLCLRVALMRGRVRKRIRDEASEPDPSS